MGLNTQNVNLKMTAGFASQFPADPIPQIALSGRSNVGKSSMINCLLGRKSMARTSEKPGKTATINFYSNGEIDLVDLPGYGFANKSKSEKQRFGRLIGGYFEAEERDIALVLVLLDVRHNPSALDLSMIDFLIDNEFPFIIVFTKCDKLSKKQLSEREEEFAKVIDCFEDIHHVFTSSENGSGIEELREVLEESL
jgi:GTP-binding protein